MQLLITSVIPAMSTVLICRIAGAGSNICLHYNSQEPSVLLKELSTYRVAVHSIQADLSSASECERLAREAIEWSPSGGIDILVSNAGAGKLKNWLEVGLVRSEKLNSGYYGRVGRAIWHQRPACFHSYQRFASVEHGLI